MAKSRPYSARLRYEIETEERAMKIIDSFDNPNAEYKGGDWIREAIVMRLEMEEEMLKAGILDSEMTAEDKAPRMTAVLLEALQNLSRPAAASDIPISGISLDASAPVDAKLADQFSRMDQEQQGKWLTDAARMRYAIEEHAPAFFLSRYPGPAVDRDDAVPAEIGMHAEELYADLQIRAEDRELEVSETSGSRFMHQLMRALPGFIELGDAEGGL